MLIPLSCHILQRCFRMDHLALIGVDEEEDTDSEDAPDRAEERSTGQKCKHMSKGRVHKEDDFWACVDEFFEAEVKNQGHNLRGSTWKLYVDQCIHRDLAAFGGTDSRYEEPNALPDT
ncbi:hypothetical protein A0H81_06575 [Grifola frondosa]|uniref:Uncharacterized protein n=1 Tax=Grifola frondosa TaxID=5627 RepID=A0A1C7M9W9_GRIFR|nr:hypothetical protein A0H81_06575 [Grifola frondosa]